MILLPNLELKFRNAARQVQQKLLQIGLLCFQSGNLHLNFGILALMQSIVLLHVLFGPQYFIGECLADITLFACEDILERCFFRVERLDFFFVEIKFFMKGFDGFLMVRACGLLRGCLFCLLK